MRKLIAVLCIFLAACSSTPVTTDQLEKVDTPVFHPPMPKPVQVCYVHWNVLVVDNQPFVALSYEDNINFAMCGKDLEAYISELHEVICHYRQCDKENNNDKNSRNPSK